MTAAAALAVLPAAGLWLWVFRAGPRGFWRRMGWAAGLLGAAGLGLGRPALGPPTAADLGEGAAAALGLWVVFWLGARGLRAVAPRLADRAGAVYGLVAPRSRWAVTILLLAVVGPGEELFWRGLVQRSLAHRLPTGLAVLAGAGLYAWAHVVTGDPVLVLAAGVGGLWWGGVYAVTGRLWVAVVAHAVWDPLALVWLPLEGPRPGGAAGRRGRTRGRGAERTTRG